MNQYPISTWLTVPNPDSLGWIFIPNKSAKWIQEKGRMCLDNKESSPWHISTFVKTNFKKSLNFFLTFQKLMNQPEESGIPVENQRIICGWFIWRMIWAFYLISSRNKSCMTMPIRTRPTAIMWCILWFKTIKKKGGCAHMHILLIVL